MPFERVCAFGQLADGEASRVETSRGPVTLFRVDGEYFATQDKCTHGDWSLADGYLEGDEIECPLHGGRFCVRTGEVKAFPPTVPLRTFPVKVQGEDVLVAVDG